MIRKLVPVLLGVIGLMIGTGAGYGLRPAPKPTPATAAAEGKAVAVADPGLEPEYVKLSNQFIVPVLDKGRVAAMVILSLSLEVSKGGTAKVYDVEPKLRDAFLQVMFDHANAGGFNGAYTDGANLTLLRAALLEAAKSIMGDVVSDVLIIEIVRQDS